MDGRRPSFEDAFRAEYGDVVRAVSPIVGSVADAEAVVQDAFVKAFTRWGRISRYDRPGAWVRRVALRDAVRFAERNRRTLPEPSVGGDLTEAVSASVDLHAALLQLPPKQRACVVLHYLADWPVSQVAEVMGCREATVRVQLHRARGALAESLEDHSEEITDGR